MSQLWSFSQGKNETKKDGGSGEEKVSTNGHPRMEIMIVRAS